MPFPELISLPLSYAAILAEFSKIIKKGYNTTYSLFSPFMLNFFKKKRKKDSKLDYLVVGLGNPGEKYRRTAHNAGFRVVSLLRKEEELPHFEKDNTLSALLSKGVIDKKKIALLLPLTFMNRSGEATGKAVKRFLNSSSQLIVVHDDTDLSMGKIKFSFQRGSAGHKGVQSIIDHLRSKSFYRLRVGVGLRDEKAVNTVLKDLPQTINEVEKKAASKLKEKILGELSSETIQLKDK